MPPPDRAALAVFVQDFTDATGLGVTSEPFCFGDSAQLPDELAALVRCGRKRATATTVVELEQAGEPLATIGQLSVVYDGAGQPVCVIRTEQLSVGSPDDVLDPAFAWDDGEGDRTYEDWLSQHSVYWRRVLPRVGAEFSLDLRVVLERFSVLWPQRDEAEVLAAREDAYVRPVWIEDRDWLADTMRQRWDGVVISRGEVLEPAGLPALIGVDRGGLRLGRPPNRGPVSLVIHLGRQRTLAGRDATARVEPCALLRPSQYPRRAINAPARPLSTRPHRA